MHLQIFHQQLTDLLNLIGFKEVALKPNQEVFSMDVDKLYTIHCLAASPTTWVILAELSEPLASEKNAHHAMLKINQPIGTTWQPIMGLNDKNHPIVWLSLPLHGLEPLTSLEAFQAVSDAATSLHSDFIAYDPTHWDETSIL